MSLNLTLCFNDDACKRLFPTCFKINLWEIDIYLKAILMSECHCHTFVQTELIVKTKPFP